MSKLTPEDIAFALEYCRYPVPDEGTPAATCVAALEAIGRVRELAEKLRDWKGALVPIILAAIDGEEKP